MKQKIVSPSGVPTANLAINKSRIKIYNKAGSMPTYYLEKGQEFQIELFNPTSDTVLAKIHLNGKAITQGGLVIKPGQRVFLERYIDVAKKFLFDTYDVNNTAEVRKAIEDNGDFKVEFYRESQPNCYFGSSFGSYNQWYNQLCDQFNSNLGTYHNGTLGTYHNGTPADLLRNIQSFDTNNLVNCDSFGTKNLVDTSGTLTSSITPTSLDFTDKKTIKKKQTLLSAKLSKTIETGRVEKGSNSNQKLEYVNTKFESYAFHTVEYKMLPLSQKMNTSEDLNVKRYCSNCGAKHKPNYKFCPSCGAKA